MSKKYFLYKLKQTKENSEIAEKFRFNYEDINNIWIYTDKRKPVFDCEKIDPQKSNLKEDISKWILENEITITRESVIKSAGEIKSQINDFFKLLDGELENQKNRKDKSEDING